MGGDGRRWSVGDGCHAGEHGLAATAESGGVDLLMDGGSDGGDVLLTGGEGRRRGSNGRRCSPPGAGVEAAVDAGWSGASGGLAVGSVRSSLAGGGWSAHAEDGGWRWETAFLGSGRSGVVEWVELGADLGRGRRWCGSLGTGLLDFVERGVAVGQRGWRGRGGGPGETVEESVGGVSEGGELCADAIDLAGVESGCGSDGGDLELEGGVRADGKGEVGVVGDGDEIAVVVGVPERDGIGLAESSLEESAEHEEKLVAGDVEVLDGYFANVVAEASLDDEHVGEIQAALVLSHLSGFNGDSRLIFLVRLKSREKIVVCP